MEEVAEQTPVADETLPVPGNVRRKKLLVLGAAGAILVLLLGVGLWWLLRGTAPKKAPAPVPTPAAVTAGPAAASPIAAAPPAPTAEEQAALAKKAEQQREELLAAHRHILEAENRGTVEGLAARLAKPAAPAESKAVEKAAEKAAEKAKEKEAPRPEAAGRDPEKAAPEADKTAKPIPLPTGRGFEVNKDNVEGLKDLIEQMNRADTRPPKKARPPGGG